MEGTKTATQYSVPNLERSFRILELLGQANEGRTLSELTKLTGYPQNSIYRICRTLEELGYLKRDLSSRKHRLTTRILQLALGSLSPGKNIASIAAPFLAKIAQETGETCALGTLVDGRGIVLQVAEGTQSFRFHLDLGMSFLLHTSAPGKAMLSLLETPQRERLVHSLDLVRHTENTIVDAPSLLAHLEKVAERGYAIDNEEELLGQRCLGAAIRTGPSTPPCSVWITAPTSRLSEKTTPAWGRLIRQACVDIEEILEFS